MSIDDFEITLETCLILSWFEAQFRLTCISFLQAVGVPDDMAGEEVCACIKYVQLMCLARVFSPCLTTCTKNVIPKRDDSLSAQNWGWVSPQTLVGNRGG